MLLSHLGTPENLLNELMDPPPRHRIGEARENLIDLGAIEDDSNANSEASKVEELGRV